MDYKPQDLFLSFYNLFSIALPGAILTHSIITSGLNQWIFPKVSIASGSPEAWVAFFVSSYFVGHFAQLIASPLDNIYDQWYEEHKTKQSSSLKDAANELDLKLVYGFVSKHGSIEKMIEERAKKLATEIVMRTNTTMTLEDQQNSMERIDKAIAQKTVEIKFEMPKYLWD